MGLGAAIGAGAGLLMGKKATQPAVTGQQQAQQSSNQQSSSGPWAGAEPGLHTLYNAATANYLNGGPQYYPGQTVADQSWATQKGLDMAQQRALVGGAAWGGAPALDAAQNNAINTSNGTFLNSNPTLAAYENASNFNANGMQGMNTLNFVGTGGALGQTSGMGGLGSFGGGANVGRTAGDAQLGAIGNGALLNGNPYVDQMFQQAAGQVGNNFAKNVMPGVASMFAGAGRYGSEAMANGMDNAQQQYGNQINQLATSIYGGNYSNERNLQQQALNQLSNIGLGERGQQLQGLQSLGGLSQGERSQMLSALQNLTGNQLQGQGLDLQALGGASNAYSQERQNQMTAMGLAPALSQADYLDSTQQQGVGQAIEGYQQQLIDANKARWDYGQNANNNNLAFLNSIMSGVPQAGQSSGSSFGNSSGTTMQAGNPMAPLSGAFLGGILGQGIGKMF